MIEEYTLRLQGIRFRTHLGASQPERAIPQEIAVDVELTLPPASLPARDRRQDIVDYDAIAGLVVQEGKAERYRLLETYARRLVARLLVETPAERVRVSAMKARVPTTHDVGCAIVELVARRSEPE
jgi:dihydroneopterin aldolase